VRVSVVAGAVFDREGRVLIAERPAGKHLAGRWEFPGGKIGAGEPLEVALARELREELGIAVDVDGCERLMTLTHAYPDREVELHLFVVDGWDGTPRGLDGQGLKWVPLAALGAEDLLEADRPFVEALQRRGPPATINCCAAPAAARTAGA
jgi:8-oxo-dGTP diphosphatase